MRTFLALPNGIPSHDTFGRVFRLLDPEELRRCFVAWVRAVLGESAAGDADGSAGPQVVAVDGKTLRRSHDRRSGKEALHLVSAWATASGLVVGQVATDAPGPRRRDGHDRRDGLPDRHRRADRRAGGRLRPGTQGQPRTPARPGP